MSRRPSLRGLVGGVLLGAGTEAVLVGWALTEPARVDAWTEVLAVRGEADAWLGGERSSVLVRWINVESIGPLVSGGGVASDALPPWMKLPPRVGARHVRVAAVGVGWPLRAVGMHWVADRSDQGFPPPAEKESSGDAPKEAVRRLRDAMTGAAATGTNAGEPWFDWTAAAADGVLLGVPWYAMIEWVRARRRGVTPRG